MKITMLTCAMLLLAATRSQSYGGDREEGEERYEGVRDREELEGEEEEAEEIAEYPEEVENAVEEEDSPRAQPRGDVGNYVVESGYTVGPPRDDGLKFSLLPSIHATSIRPAVYSSVVFDPDGLSHSQFSRDFFSDHREPTTVPTHPRSAQPPLSSIRYQNSLYDYDFAPSQKHDKEASPHSTQLQKPYVVRQQPRFVSSTRHGFQEDVRPSQGSAAASDHGEQRSRAPARLPPPPQRGVSPFNTPRPTEAPRSPSPRPQYYHTTARPLYHTTHSYPPLRPKPQHQEPPKQHRPPHSPRQQFGSSKNYAPVVRPTETVTPRLVTPSPTPLHHFRSTSNSPVQKFTPRPTIQEVEPPKLGSQTANLYSRQPQNFNEADEYEGLKDESYQLPLQNAEAKPAEDFFSNEDIYSQIVANIEAIFGDRKGSYINNERNDFFIPDPIIPVDYRSHLRSGGDEREEQEEEVSEDETDSDGNYATQRRAVAPRRTRLYGSVEAEIDPKAKGSLVTKRLAKQSSMKHEVMTDNLAMPGKQHTRIVRITHHRTTINDE